MPFLSLREAERRSNLLISTILIGVCFPFCNLPQIRIIRRGAMFGDRTVLTIRLPSHTDVPAMGNHDMAEGRPAPFRDYVGQIEFQLYRVTVIGQSQPPGQANDVRIAGDTGYAEGVTQDAIGCLSPDAGQGQELFHRAGDRALVVLDNAGAGAFDIEGLIAVESRGANVRFDLLQIEFGPVGGGFVFFEQVRRDFVDLFVRTLR